jgi:putative phosphoesterase
LIGGKNMVYVTQGSVKRMRIAVISDIHDNVWKLDAALAAVADTAAMICCGDLCSPFIVHQIGRAYAMPVHIVFGNNDGDQFRITSIAAQYPQFQIHGEFFTAEFDGRRVAVNHFDAIARPIVASGQFDAVCFGHNHRFEIARSGSTLAINPGTLMGAAFGADGTREDVPSTFAIYDTQSGDAEGYAVAPDQQVVPYRL